MSARHRSTILHRIANEMERLSEQLAQLLTAEQGKPLREARAEITYSANYFRWFAEEAMRVQGEIIPADSQNKRIFVVRQPIGVVGIITPWNFPSAMIARKLAAALAAGCTCVIKPAPETPFSALALGALCESCGVAKGAVSVVTGEADPIARALLESEAVRKISFTGSTEIGQLLMRESAATVKRLTLELGGNAPFIVCEDADLDHAANQAIAAKFRNAGQTCISVNRIFVHASIKERFTGKLLQRVAALRTGDGRNDSTDIGPLISESAVQKVRTLVADALQNGAHIIHGQAPAEHNNSLFVHPLVIDSVNDNMRLSCEEIFGPVLSIHTFESEEEVIRRANAVMHGLAAYVMCGTMQRGWKISEALHFGMVGINDSAISTVQAPFGGIKHSGYGREGGSVGIDEYLSMKYLSVHL